MVVAKEVQPNQQQQQLVGNGGVGGSKDAPGNAEMPAMLYIE